MNIKKQGTVNLDYTLCNVEPTIKIEGFEFEGTKDDDASNYKKGKLALQIVIRQCIYHLQNMDDAAQKLIDEE